MVEDEKKLKMERLNTILGSIKDAMKVMDGRDQVVAVKSMVRELEAGLDDLYGENQ